MGKKKRKKSGKNGSFAAVGSACSILAEGLFRGLPFLAVMLGLAVVFFGVRGALFADLSFKVDKIVVVPAQTLSIPKRQELESRLIGKNILQMDLKKLARELERDTQIEEARVVRRLPSTLEIAFIKRELFAQLQSIPRGSYAEISLDGMILNISRERVPALTLIEGFGSGIKDQPIGREIRHAGLDQAIRFAKAFSEHPFAREESLAKLGFDRHGNVKVTLVGGPVILLGRQPLERFGALEKAMRLLREEDRSRIDYIDLQFDNVIVKRKR